MRDYFRDFPVKTEFGNKEIQRHWKLTVSETYCETAYAILIVGFGCINYKPTQDNKIKLHCPCWAARSTVWCHWRRPVNNTDWKSVACGIYKESCDTQRKGTLRQKKSCWPWFLEYNQFICGRKVDVKSDHWPLESVMKKLLLCAPR